jgi:CheY-like chemotaxis protein
MDVEMPVMDGYEATRRIRGLGVPWAGGIPIVALTGHALPEFRARCLASGMNDHLEKPVRREKLHGALMRWIGPGKELPGSGAGAASSGILEADPVGPVAPVSGSGAGGSDPGTGGASGREVIQVRAGLAYVSGKVPVYAKMLRVFTDTYGGAAREISGAWEARDVTAVRHLVHKLKSIAGMIGARDLAAMAGSLEGMLGDTADPSRSVIGKDGSFPGEAGKMLERFVRELETVMETGLGLLKGLEAGTPAGHPAREPSGTSFPAVVEEGGKLSRLAVHLRGHQPLESLAILKRMALETRDENRLSRIREIRALIGKYRFREAEGLLGFLAVPEGGDR